MSTEDQLTRLLDVTTADVPAEHAAPPLDSIRSRVRRRRRARACLVAVAAAVVLAGGYSVGARWLVEPVPRMPVAAPAPTTPSAPPVPWGSAMVARDDTTVTVYAGAPRCEELDAPQARITAQDAGQVTVEVTGETVPASDCAATGFATPVVVRLPAPLAGRTLLDAVGRRSRPAYFQRHLPKFAAGSPWASEIAGAWQSDDPGWYGGRNGPAGAALHLRAQPAGSAQPSPSVGTMKVGPYQGTITGGGQMWTVWWQADGATYSLQLVPAEGRTITLKEFKRRVTELWT